MTSLLSLALAPYRATLGAPDPWDPARRWPFTKSSAVAVTEPLSPPAATAEHPSEGRASSFARPAPSEPVIAMSVVPASWGQKVEISR